VTDRHTVDSITSDDLDQLYDRLEKLAQTIAAFPDANDAASLAHARAQRDRFITQAKRAEAVITRLRDSAASLHSRGFDTMSARFVLDIIDGRRDESARTTANNPPANETATQATRDVTS
jgi:uncharacterized protein (DUF934 family)